MKVLEKIAKWFLWIGGIIAGVFIVLFTYDKVKARIDQRIDYTPDNFKPKPGEPDKIYVYPLYGEKTEVILPITEYGEQITSDQVESVKVDDSGVAVKVSHPFRKNK